MKPLREAKTDRVADDAQEAYESGQPIFTPVLTVPQRQVQAAGTTEIWREIAAIEAVGWKLDQWSIAPNMNNAVVAMPIFRR